MAGGDASRNRMHGAASDPLALDRDAAERLLADEGLRARLRAASERLQAAPGTVRAADLIEQVVRAPARA
jgi:UDP:flavonoid glycosyltransferase YjiC (YdhE family)